MQVPFSPIGPFDQGLLVVNIPFRSCSMHISRSARYNHSYSESAELTADSISYLQISLGSYIQNVKDGIFLRVLEFVAASKIDGSIMMETSTCSSRI